METLSTDLLLVVAEIVAFSRVDALNDMLSTLSLSATCSYVRNVLKHRKGSWPGSPFISEEARRLFSRRKRVQVYLEWKPKWCDEPLQTPTTDLFEAACDIWLAGEYSYPSIIRNFRPPVSDTAFAQEEKKVLALLMYNHNVANLHPTADVIDILGRIHKRITLAREEWRRRLTTRNGLVQTRLTAFFCSVDS